MSGSTPSASSYLDLEAEVGPHGAKKDTVQFFYADGVPYDLIERIPRVLAARHHARLTGTTLWRPGRLNLDGGRGGRPGASSRGPARRARCGR